MAVAKIVICDRIKHISSKNLIFDGSDSCVLKGLPS